MTPDLPSDDYPDNDSYGYKVLADVLMRTKDDPIALVAWFMLGPYDIFPNNDIDDTTFETEETVA